MTASPLERAARALCSLDGHPENAKMEGKPLWMDYLPEVRAVVSAIYDPVVGALKPFADCCEQIDAEEDDEEWAKFRLLVKDYRRTGAALAMIDAMLDEGERSASN